MEAESFKLEKKYCGCIPVRSAAVFIGVLTLLESIPCWGLGMIQIYEMFDRRTHNEKIFPLVALACGGLASTILLPPCTFQMVYGVIRRRYELLVNWIFIYVWRLILVCCNLVYYSNYLQFSVLSDKKTSLPRFMLEFILVYGCLMIYNWVTVIQLQVQLRFDAMIRKNLAKITKKTVTI